MKLIVCIVFFYITSIGYCLQAYLSYNSFLLPNNQPYIETYMTIIGKSVIFKKNSANKYQACIEVTMLFKEANEIKNFKKYIINSPEIDDTLHHYPNFIDLQRIELNNGIYNYDLIIQDKNSNDKPFEHTDIININMPSNEICFSGIQLIEKYEPTQTTSVYSKNNYDIIPYVSNYFPQNMNTLSFYVELYNTSEVLGNNKSFLIKYFIEDYYSKKYKSSYHNFKRLTSSKILPFLSEFNIETLESGNYNLVIELRDTANKLIKETKLFFQRNNPPTIEINTKELEQLNVTNSFVEKYTNIDSLTEFIHCLYPIASDKENAMAKNLINNKNLQYMQQFFFMFWSNRNAINPEQEWLNYLKQVNVVNTSYSTFVKKGYETDRGRIYLKYGTPNTINTAKHEPSAYPYEIWHYYKIEDQTNVKFIFYNPSIVEEDYILLHSTAKGEIFNKNWELILHSRSFPIYDFDQETERSHFGGKTIENYKK